MTARPRRHLTFLFTDLERSTQLWSEFPDEMPDVIERHESILDAAIEGAGGAVMKHTGDGVDGTFADPVAAVGAALRAQREVLSADWSPLPGLGVRIGIHTGEAHEHGDDFLGSTLNMTARLRDAGHGGQVLLSEPVVQILTERPIDGCAVVDLGPHLLRGLQDRHHIFQLTHPDLPRHFDSLRTLGAARPLYVPATSFHGRAAERDELASLLEAATAVTLIGPGGVGKTRLAVEVAIEVGHRFRDGVRMVDLVRAEPAGGVPIVAEDLGIVRRDPNSFEDSILDWLVGKELLLVLDNCERVCEEIGDLVRHAGSAAPGVTFLCTSRQRLGFAGEVCLELAPLPVADGDDVDDLLASPAVRLLGDRIGAARSGFRSGPGNVETLAAICRRLDGLPLALELAAARARSMSLDDIARNLHAGSPVLTTAAPDHPRHGTLQATIDWSYDTLPAERRSGYVRLSVFVGAFTVDAARALWPSDLPSAQVLSALADLADRSMLVAQLDGPETRYRMLVPLREDALRRLDLQGETEKCRDQHARFHLQRAEQGEHGLLTEAEEQWARRLAEELGDIEAAHDWALQRGDTDLAARLVLALWNHGLQRLLPEYFRWVDRTMAAIDVDAHPRAADLHGIAALSAWLRADPRASADRCRAAFAAEERMGTGVTLPARMAAIIAASYAPEQADDRLGELGAERTARFVEVVQACRASGVPFWMVYSLVVGSLGWSMAGEPAHATAQAERALDAARRSGCPTSIAWALLALGSGYEQSDPERAERLLDESVRTAKTVDSRLVMGLSLSLLAVLRRRLRRLSEAAPLLRELLDLWDQLGNRPQLWHAVREGAMCLAVLGRDEEAATLLASVEHAGLVMPLLPADQADLAELQQQVRARLGTEAFDRAQRQGRLLEREDAATVARIALSEVPFALTAVST
jgi:predicted ATPase/class 3 adenylate cyclase